MHDHFDGGRIPHLAIQMLRAVQYLHQHDIIHCNIEPNNCLVEITMGDLLQLTGFEEARVERDGFREEISPLLAAEQGLHIGRLEFRAVEILLGDTNFSFGVDIWSIGMILHTMAVKQTVLTGNTPSDVLESLFSSLSGPSPVDVVELASLPGWKASHLRYPENTDWAHNGPTAAMADLVHGMLTYAPSRCS